MDIYAKAYTRKKEEEMRLMEMTAWATGMYAKEAILSAFDKRHKYPQNPAQKEQDDSSALPEEEKFKLWAVAFNSKFKSKETV